MKTQLLLTSLFAALLLAPATAQTASSGTVELHATPRECEVLAVLGKAKLGWKTTAAPEGAYNPETTEFDDGHNGNIPGTKPDRRYFADCHWQDFGLAEPVAPADPLAYGLVHYGFNRPHFYDNDNGVQASWQTIVVNKSGNDVSLVSKGETCRMTRSNASWQILRCTPSNVTSHTNPAPDPAAKN